MNSKHKEYMIDLGSGARGYRRYKVLKHLLRDLNTIRGTRLDFRDAHTIRLWSKTSRFRIAQQSPFRIYLDADEWEALGRGLRALKTPPAKTMYLWCVAHKWAV